MKFRMAIILVLVLMSSVSFAQDSLTFQWEEIRTYDIDSNEVWAVDRLENVFISKKSVINKYDTAGVLKFSQSIKSFGKMHQLVPINTMKLVHFSEEQQTLCFLDNTLTPFDDCIELVDNDIVNADMVASSIRPDMLWVFDNLNSKLVLLPLVESGFQGQAIANLKGVLDIDSVSQMVEYQNQLHVVEKGSGVYIFDMYGSLVQEVEIEGVLYIDVFKESIVALTDTNLIIKSKEEEESFTLELPEENILEIKYLNEHFFVRTSKHVHKFRLELKK